MRRKAAAACSMIVLAAAGLGAVTAHGHKFFSGSEVTISELRASGASGKVTSKRKVCRRNRTVALFKHEPGANSQFGTAKTDKSGAWRYEQALPSAFQDKYKVKLLPKRVQNAKHKHICGGAQSGFSTL